MKEPNVNIDKQSLTPDDLLKGLRTDGKYEHLRIILSKNNNRTTGQEYLVVSPLRFGVYQLLEVDFEKGQIKMTLRNTETDDVVEERLEVNDTKPQLFLVCWDDIKRIVYNDKPSNPCKADLLDFDY